LTLDPKPETGDGVSADFDRKQSEREGREKRERGRKRKK